MDLDHGLFNGVSVVAVFDHRPDVEVCARVAAKAGVDAWVIVCRPLSDRQRAYVEPYGRETDGPGVWLDPPSGPSGKVDP